MYRLNVVVIALLSLITTTGNKLAFAQINAVGSIYLDGVGDYVNLFFLEQDSIIIESRTFTIEAWALTSGVGGVGNQNPIFVQRDEPGAAQSSTIHLTGPSSSDNIASFGLRSSSGATQGDLASISGIAHGEWHHYAGVADSSKMSLYIDGELASATDINHSGNYTTSIDNIEIGRHLWVINGETSVNYFNGVIDEVRIWKKVLTEEKIRATMGDTLGPAYYTTADSGLVGYWRFDELEDLGVGDAGVNDARDYSVLRNHGDLHGDAKLVYDTPIPIPTGTGLSTELSKVVQLGQNYPNPFRNETTIWFDLQRSSTVSLKVFDMLGREQDQLASGRYSPGRHLIEWRPGNLASGLYLLRMHTDEGTEVSRIIVLR